MGSHLSCEQARVSGDVPQPGGPGECLRHVKVWQMEAQTQRPGEVPPPKDKQGFESIWRKNRRKRETGRSGVMVPLVLVK